MEREVREGPAVHVFVSSGAAAEWAESNASSDYFADRSKDHTGNNDIAWEDSKVKKERRTEEEVLQEGLKEHHGADAVHSPSSRVPYLPILEAPMMPWSAGGNPVGISLSWSLESI